MIDFYEPEDFDRTVYIVNPETLEISEQTLRDVCLEFANKTTTPLGVHPIIHARDCELWSWGHMGSFPAKIETFDTEAEAEHAAMLCHRYDLYHNGEALHVYDTREEAEAALLEDENETTLIGPIL